MRAHRLSILWQRKGPEGIPGHRVRRGYLVLRLLTLLSLVAAVTGLSPIGKPAELHTILLLDRSASIDNPAEAARLLSGTAEDLRESDPISLVVFARKAYTIRERQYGFEFNSLAPFENQATRIDTAIEHSLRLLNPGEKARILLFSDGRETGGESLSAARLAGELGVPIYSMALPSRPEESASLLGLTIPPRIAAGETFRAFLSYAAAAAYEAEIVMLLDGQPLGRDLLRLEPGGGSISYELRIEESGVHTLEMQLSLPGSAQLPGVDLIEATTYVSGPSRVLIVSGNPEEAPYLGQALEAQGYSVTEATASDLSSLGAALFNYSTLILDEVPAFDLSLATMAEIERYVLEYGGGLLMLGGEGSFGTGGYYQTPIEELLPVEMDPAASLFVPTLNMLTVLDTSGSMAGTNVEGESKLAILKEAVLAAARLLNPSFEVGVISFDAGYKWVLPFVKAGDAETISEKLGRLQAGGGTVLYPALEEAYRALIVRSAAVKHLIILSDGLVKPAPFETLVTRMAADGITVSTVAVSADSDRRLMEEIATWGGGRSYYTASISSAPRIFASESMIVSRNMLIDETFFPFLQQDHAVLQGLTDQGMPPLFGFQAVYPRPNAVVPLLATDDNPLLAMTRPGLGRSAAFTSSFDGGWGREWTRWELFPRFAGQLTGWLARPGETAGARLRLVSGDGGIEARLTVVDPLRGPRLLEAPSLIFGAPGEKTMREPLLPVAPGEYSAQLPETAGRLIYAAAYGPEFLTMAGLALPVQAEMRPGPPDTALLRKISDASGGVLLDKPEDFPTYFPTADSQPHEIPHFYLILAALMLLGDVALRLWPNRGARGKALEELEQGIEGLESRQRTRDPRFWFGG